MFAFKRPENTEISFLSIKIGTIDKSKYQAATWKRN